MRRMPTNEEIKQISQNADNITEIKEFSDFLSYNSTDDIIETEKPIVENVDDYSYTEGSKENITINTIYAGVAKNGNKLTLVAFVSITRSDTVSGGFATFGSFAIPTAVLAKLYPYEIGDSSIAIDYKNLNAYKKTDASSQALNFYVEKTLTGVDLTFTGVNLLDANDEYVIRIEETFLLSDNLAE